MLPEQEKEIKQQLCEKIKQLYPGQKDILCKEINEMSIPELEEFLKQNKIQIQSPEKEKTTEKSQEQIKCIFCSIAQGQIPSYKIDENKDSLAVLEINPISKAHSLVIPKKHTSETQEIPSSSFALAKKIAKKIKTKFKPKEIEITSSKIMDHAIINILPIYENENLNSQRQKASEQDLKELQKKLEKTTKKKTIKKSKPKKIQKTKENLWLPRRIP